MSDPSPLVPDAEPLPGIRRVEQIMGTAIGIDARDGWVAAADLEVAFAYLRDIDARFSMYRPDSEVSRLSRGELAAQDCSPDVREALELCEAARVATEGYFDIRAHRPDGTLDPSGLVKGWALENAGRLLERAGARNFCINGGGDIVVRGAALAGATSGGLARGPGGRAQAEQAHSAGPAWRVGIRHPRLADRLAAVLAVSGSRAIATSGAYERGEHVRDPFTGRAPTGVLSVTVVGPSLTFADAYATAAFAMGPTGLAWIAGLAEYSGCAITGLERLSPDATGDGAGDASPIDGDRLAWTPGFERYFADREQRRD